MLRVIAAGINAENCSVVRVMTPEPDTVSPQTSIFQALKKMHGKNKDYTIKRVIKQQ